MEFLVALDFSDSTSDVIKQAEKLAVAFSAKLRVLHVAEPDPEFVGYGVGPQNVRDSLAKIFHKEHQKLQQICSELRTEGVVCTGILAQGQTAETIINESKKLSVDIIVIGSHGKGLAHNLFLGSTSKEVLHKSNIPVLLVPLRGRT